MRTVPELGYTLYPVPCTLYMYNEIQKHLTHPDYHYPSIPVSHYPLCPGLDIQHRNNNAQGPGNFIQGCLGWGQNRVSHPIYRSL